MRCPRALRESGQQLIEMSRELPIEASTGEHQHPPFAGRVNKLTGEFNHVPTLTEPLRKQRCRWQEETINGCIVVKSRHHWDFRVEVIPVKLDVPTVSRNIKDHSRRNWPQRHHRTITRHESKHKIGNQHPTNKKVASHDNKDISMMRYVNWQKDQNTPRITNAFLCYEPILSSDRVSFAPSKISAHASVGTVLAASI